MAYCIEPTAVLKGKDAIRFMKMMETAASRAVDYSEERKTAEEIIKKSDLSFLL